MDSGHIVEEAPALHGLTPELMFQACFVQACTGAFQYVPILALYDTISGRSVVRAGVVPPFEAARCLFELSCVVGVEEFGLQLPAKSRRATRVVWASLDATGLASSHIVARS